MEKTNKDATPPVFLNDSIQVPGNALSKSQAQEKSAAVTYRWTSAVIVSLIVLAITYTGFYFALTYQNRKTYKELEGFSWVYQFDSKLTAIDINNTTRTATKKHTRKL